MRLNSTRKYYGCPVSIEKNDFNSVVSIRSADFHEVNAVKQSEQEAVESAIMLLDEAIKSRILNGEEVVTTFATLEEGKTYIYINSSSYTADFIDSYNLLPIVRKCIQATGIKFFEDNPSSNTFYPSSSILIPIGGGYSKAYWPFINDEQAFQLAKHFNMELFIPDKTAKIKDKNSLIIFTSDVSINDAIVNCAYEFITGRDFIEGK